MTENEKDIQLLHSDPNRLIVKYQRMIHAVVASGLRSGWFPASEWDDVIQTVSLELMAKMNTVRENYDGRALLKTYLSQIALNICRVYHQNRPELEQLAESMDVVSRENRILEDIIVGETKVRFRKILLLFGRRLPKILLFLRIFYRFPVSAKDILDSYPDCRKEDIEALLASYSQAKSAETDKEIIAFLAPILNKIEDSSTSADGYRRWIHHITGEICDLLNGYRPRAAFNRETFFLLFEEYSFPFSDKKGYKDVERGQA
jgi:hypothetical protein